MWKTISCILLISSVVLSCRQKAKSEHEEIGFWKTSFVDSSYRLMYTEKDTVNALRYFDAAYRKTGKNAVYPSAVRFDMLANYHYFFTGNNEETAAMIDSALALYNTTEQQNHYPKTYVGLLLFGGHIAYRLSEYGKANDYYFRAKKLADAYLSPCERTAFHYSIAMVLYRQKNFAQSACYFRQAYALQETCTPQTTAVVLQQQEIQSNIGLCLMHLQKYDSALHHFNKALAIANRYMDSLGPIFMDNIRGVIMGNKALVAIAQARYREAEQLALASIRLTDREGYDVGYATDIKLQLADMYSRLHDTDRLGAMLGSLDHKTVEGSANLRLNWNRLKAAYCEQTDQKEEALNFLKAYQLINDSLTADQAKLVAADVARQLREKAQAVEIAVLKKDRQFAETLLWVAIVFFIMAMVIIALVYQNYRRNKKSLALSLALNEEINRQKEAREEEEKQRHRLITEAVIKAQEKERSAIGLELHDNISQVLTTIKLHNEMLLEGTGDPKHILPRTLSYLQMCITEIRSLSRRLSAPTLGKISLEESVKDLIDSINLTSKVKITHSISGLKYESLKQDIHLGVYRILQEQLNNVIKHAEASEVKVELEQTNGLLHLSVTDNGKGFLINGKKNGIGLINMQTRAESLNGTFHLQSKPGQGCSISVVVPCLS